MLSAIAAIALSQIGEPQPITIKVAFLANKEEFAWQGLPGKRTMFEKSAPNLPVHATVFTGSLKEFNAFMGYGSDSSDLGFNIISRPIARSLIGHPACVSVGDSVRGTAWQAVVNVNPQVQGLFDVTLNYAPVLRDPKCEEPWPFTHKFSMMQSQTMALGFKVSEKDKRSVTAQALLFEVVPEN